MVHNQFRAPAIIWPHAPTITASIDTTSSSGQSQTTDSPDTTTEPLVIAQVYDDLPQPLSSQNRFSSGYVSFFGSSKNLAVSN